MNHDNNSAKAKRIELLEWIIAHAPEELDRMVQYAVPRAKIRAYEEYIYERREELQWLKRSINERK
jgi:hypothetical protein